MKVRWSHKAWVAAAASILLVFGGAQASLGATSDPEAPDGVEESVWEDALSSSQREWGAGDKATLEAQREIGALGVWDRCNDDVNYILGGNRFIALPGFGNYDPTCFLESGNTGLGVRTLQKALNFCYGKGLVVDGDFGPATRNALIQVQSQIGTVADGVYGQNTRNAMRFPRTDGAGSYTGACFTYAYANQFPKNNI